jgi:hypothetical protein
MESVHPLSNGMCKLPLVKRCPGGYRVGQWQRGCEPCDETTALVCVLDITEKSFTCFMQGSYLDAITAPRPVTEHFTDVVRPVWNPCAVVFFLAPRLGPY